MRALRPLVLIGIGGLLYVLVELAFRGRSHWTMFLVGGLCFWLIGLINEVLPWEMPLWKQCIIGAVIVTAMEFLAGCVINLWLGWDVWDYSNMPFNVLGQICLPFSLLWILLSAVAIVLDDHLRYWIYGEEKPHYTWT
nr:MAG TPA: Putative ABC-transporter type IV [Bacteriophage sp.]